MAVAVGGFCLHRVCLQYDVCVDVDHHFIIIYILQVFPYVDLSFEVEQETEEEDGDSDETYCSRDPYT